MVREALSQNFGFSDFREGQLPVIERLVDGRSAIAVFPTGAGKSLCYQLPALLLPHLTLVVAPLLALIEDQLAFLQSKGIAAASIDSTRTYDENAATFRAVRSGQIKILMVSVERFRNERFRQLLRQIKVSLLVVDEAHCISEWGHNFRPDYLQLPRYRRQYEISQVLLLTATATPEVVADMCQKFRITQDAVMATGFHRPNLELGVEGVEQKNKANRLIEWLLPRCGGDLDSPSSVIVYVTLQQTADDIAALCSEYGIIAASYHAGMENEKRLEIQTRFMADEISCVVATIAFGMGIDKPNIRHIVHYDLPKSIENYSQEVGRAGRDDKPASCLVLANLENRNVLENFVYGNTPDRSGIEAVIDDIESIETGHWEVMLSRLSAQSNIRQLPLKTLLVYLEMLKIIKPLHSYYSEISFRLVVDESAIISRFEGERREFVEKLLQACPVAKVWRKVDFELLEESSVGDRDRVRRALDYFAEQELVEIQTRYMTDVYSVQRGFDREDVINRLEKQFNKKERSEIARIERMIDFFSGDRCLAHELAVYFGDDGLQTDCGNCSVCKGKVAKMPSQVARSIPSTMCLAELMAPLQELVNEKKPEFKLTTDAVTRFFCGLSQPAFTSMRANRLDEYAIFRDIAYIQVRDWVMTGLTAK